MAWAVQISQMGKVNDRRFSLFACLERTRLACIALRLAGAVGALLLLVSCSHGVATQETLESPVSDRTATVQMLSTVCCQNAEEFPRVLVGLADFAAPVFGRVTRVFESRPGYLSDQPGAQAYLRQRLRPLDMAIITSDGRLSNQLLPGAFSHVAIYVESEAALRSMGVWNHPDVIPHQAEIRNGGAFIEAVSGGVRLATEQDVFNADRFVLVRPHLSSAHRRRDAIADYFGHIGTPFDYHFDGSDDSCLFCTELVDRVLPELELQSTYIYDRPVVLADQIILTALKDGGRLSMQAYVEGSPNGWEVRSRTDLTRLLYLRWQRHQTQAANTLAWSDG